MEDYKKKYEEIIKKAKEVLSRKNLFSCERLIVESIFPELAEPKDELIRKTLIAYCTERMEHSIWFAKNIQYKELIAWLEKQGQVSQPVTKKSKQVWSEDDDAMLNQAIEEVEYALNDKNLFYTGKENVLVWLKSLKDRLKGG